MHQGVIRAHLAKKHKPRHLAPAAAMMTQLDKAVAIMGKSRRGLSFASVLDFIDKMAIFHNELGVELGQDLSSGKTCLAQ